MRPGTWGAAGGRCLGASGCRCLETSRGYPPRGRRRLGEVYSPWLFCQRWVGWMLVKILISIKVLIYNIFCWNIKRFAPYVEEDIQLLQVTFRSMQFGSIDIVCSLEPEMGI